MTAATVPAANVVPPLERPTLAVSPPSTLVANPYPSTYGNASFILPNYATLNGFVNVSGATSIQTNGAQVPLVSWTADGVYYVNTSYDLVFYNFATTTVTFISTWTPLYEDLMNYNGFPNTEYITQDGSVIFGFGCATTCQGSPQPSVEFEATNLSTGSVWTYTFSGLRYSTAGRLGATYTNVQPFVIGVNGSDNEAVVVNDAGVMWGVPVGSLQNVSPTKISTLSFFEANNLVWMPTLNSFINVQAGGSTQDRWAQLRYTAPSLTSVANGTWGTGITSNFANSGGYNVTAGEFSETAGICLTEHVVTGYIPISGGVAGAFHTIPSTSPGPCNYAPPRSPLRAGSTLGVMGGGSERVPITAAGPFVAFGWNNTSAILNPVTGQWSTLGSAAYPGIYGPDATYSVANDFHNGSYLVSPRSNSCEITCSLLGHAGASSVGTEWWLWNDSLPEFPYPATSPIYEAARPAAPVLSLSRTSTTVTATWTENTTSGPLLNYTLCWSTASAQCTTAVPLMPWTTSYTLRSLAPGTTVYVAVQALNFHYFGPWANGSTTTPVNILPSAPTFSAITGSSALVSWTQGSFADGSTVANDSLLVGTTCGAWTGRPSTGGGITAYRLTGLTGGTTYCVAVEVWNGTLGSLIGPSASFTSRVTYPLVFSETGLPSGLLWVVTVNGTSQNVTTDGGTDPESFPEVNGTVPYSIGPLSGYEQRTVPYGGSESVNGAVVDVAVVYARVTYGVTFSESGLPAGEAWNVALGTSNQNRTTDGRTDSFTFPTEPNGSYAYTIGGIPGFHLETAPYTGVVTVNGGSPLTVQVHWTRVRFTVKFDEVGLPAGTPWSVNLSSGAGLPQLSNATSNSISFREPNGTYAYSLLPVPGYYVALGSTSGSVTVNGARPVDARVQWKPVELAVTFSETGLPRGSYWQAAIDGRTRSTSGTAVEFHLPNGTYPFAVNATGYTETSTPSASVTVNGTTVGVPVTFVASGVPVHPPAPAPRHEGLARSEGRTPGQRRAKAPV